MVSGPPVKSRWRGSKALTYGSGLCVAVALWVSGAVCIAHAGDCRASGAGRNAADVLRLSDLETHHAPGGGVADRNCRERNRNYGELSAWAQLWSSSHLWIRQIHRLDSGAAGPRARVV